MELQTFKNRMKVLFGVCFFLTITCYSFGGSTNNVFAISRMIQEFQEECTDSYHHYHWYPNDCQKYFSCENGTLEIKDCPLDLLWNENIKSCDVNSNIDCLDTRSITSDAVTNESSTTTEVPTTQKIECTDDHRYFQYPYDCSKYYMCSGNKAYLMSCPQNEYWNNEKQMCDWSSNVNCVSSSLPTTTTTTRATTPTTTVWPTPKIDCDSEHGLFPYPYDCSKYYECSNDRSYLMNCPIGQYWDDVAKMCDWADNVNCVASTPQSLARYTTENIFIQRTV